MRILVLCLSLAALGGPALGQSLQVLGGPVTLTIEGAAAGMDPPPAEDASTRLQYRLQSLRRFKITVSTSNPDQQFPLTVQARNVAWGTSQGRVPLKRGMAPTDLIRDLEAPSFLCIFLRCTAQSDLQYRSAVQAEDGTGTANHVVQYTIMRQ
jgi:hypothetical protein